MQYLVEWVVGLIAEKEPAPGSETIILVNGFEDLKIYAELSTVLKKKYNGSQFSINIKLAKRKWDELSINGDNVSKQQMLQNKWIAEKESVTYYRNQHSVDILVLLGTEDEDDTGGLANCFTITPDWLVDRLNGQYDKIFESCFTYELSDDDRASINGAYKAVFEFCPVDICKLSATADVWFKQFDTITEFSEEFGKHLVDWGIPRMDLKPYTPRNFRASKNFLRDEYDFISNRLFQRMTQKAYKGLATKLQKYQQEGKYSDVDWTLYGFHGYEDFSEIVLEFARGERIKANQERLLKADFAIINDILKFKTKDPTPHKVTETSIAGDPLDVILRTAIYALKEAQSKHRDDLASVHFDFSGAVIVTGYTDTDDEDKVSVLANTWKNVCVHVNGIFEFIEQNNWRLFGNNIRFVCDTSDFFDPKRVEDQINKTVTVATGTNTLNKIYFKVQLVDGNGNTLQEIKEDESTDIYKCYVWKFDNEASWLYDFKDITADTSFSVEYAKIIPIGVMHRLKNMMVIKSEVEFFDLYDEDSLELSYNLCDYVKSRALKSDSYEMKQIGILFEDLGAAFCRFISKVSSCGFYRTLCGDTLTVLNEKYNTLADKILSVMFAENDQWIKDAFLQSFVIQDGTNYIDEESDPECIIIPPWHPAALQKIAAQKRFMIDGLSQKVYKHDKYDEKFDIDKVMDRFIRMTEIQSSIDLFPAEGNDYMGIVGTYGHFCVYGNERNISSIRTRIKDVLRKEAIYDEEFKATELTRMNDDSRMIYDILKAYNKAIPSVESSLRIVFINPPDLQPIISAVSKYVSELRMSESETVINMKLSILVRPENKGGKDYLTYWMDEYFSEEKDVHVKLYLNEWSNKNELDKLLSDNNDIIFNMDLLHAETYRFIPDLGSSNAKLTDCRFPIVYKPSPLSKTSKKRKIEITQTQFSTSFKHTQIVRYKKNSETLPSEKFLAVRETSVEYETKKIIDMLHTKAYWVVCVDKVMDGALLRSDESDNLYAVIGFSTGKGMYGQYNLTITARHSILETVEKKLSDRLYRLFKWKQEVLDSAVKMIMKEAGSLDGISVLSAINPKGTNINEFMAYVMTSLREKQFAINSALKVIIHLDSYRHWFNNNDKEALSLRPDFMMLSVMPTEDKIKLKATIIECKIAAFKNSAGHIEKAKKQVRHGLEQLQGLFDPNSDSIERRYWFAQLYRALVFAQVTFSDNSDEFRALTAKLRTILDGEFEIEWGGKVLGYWLDQNGDSETEIVEEGLSICSIPQNCIQRLLTGDAIVSYVPVDEAILEEIDETSDEERERAAAQAVKEKRIEILNRKKNAIEKRQKPEPLVPIETYPEEPLNKAKVEDQKAGKLTQGDISEQIESSLNEKVDNNPVGKATVSLEDLRVLIGKDRGNNSVYWEFGNKGLSNRHLLITGTSGQGKTYGIQSMLYEVSKSNISMVVFDYTEGFRTDQLEKKFLNKMEGRLDNRIVYFTGVPINPFKRHEIEVAGMKAPEKISDVAQRIASTLAHVYSFGDQQFAAIYEACYTGLSKYGDNMSMKILESELNNSSNLSAKKVVSKMTPFLHSVEFSNEYCDWNDILYNDTGRLTIFQLTSFVREIQVIITEFMLWDMWHYTKKNGNKDKPFVVVLDEAQNLSHADNSPSGLILTEGRKFGWSAWYATQSLKVLNDDEVTRLMQSGFKLYFKPTAAEIISMAKQLNPTDYNEWKTPLTGLKKGECIVVGDRIQKDGQFKAGRPTVTKVISFEERL